MRRVIQHKLKNPMNAGSTLNISGDSRASPFPNFMNPISNFPVPLAGSSKDKNEPHSQQCTLQGDSLLTLPDQIVPVNQSRGGERSDFPTLQVKTRGSIEEAIKVASDPVRLQAAKVKLQQGFYAKKSWNTLQSHQRGVLAIAEAAGLPLVSPISEDEILTIAAAINEAGFRSGSA